MIIKYIINSIVAAFASWSFGLIFCLIIKNSAYYKKMSNLQLIKSKTLGKKIGLGATKWVVKNTFFKYFNQKLKLDTKVGMAELHELRNEMTFAEISHFVAFGLMAVFTLFQVIKGKILFGLIAMVVNVFMNLYPSLLQQENKSRIDRVIKIYR
jgi:hypothetical protein